MADAECQCGAERSLEPRCHFPVRSVRYSTAQPRAAVGAHPPSAARAAPASCARRAGLGETALLTAQLCPPAPQLALQNQQLLGNHFRKRFPAFAGCS